MPRPPHRRIGHRAARVVVVRPPEARVAADGGRAAYPVLAFGHGFLQRPWRYRGLLEALAGHGYLVVAPDTRTGPFPGHRGLAEDLVAAVEYARRTQPLAHPNISVAMGHSMGAGCALLAASRSPGFATVATMSALDTRPSMLSALATLTIPSLFVVGTADTVVPPARTREVYAACAGTPRWAEIPGGGHCGFLDSSFPRGTACGGQEIAGPDQQRRAVDILAHWLRATLSV